MMIEATNLGHTQAQTATQTKKTKPSIETKRMSLVTSDWHVFELYNEDGVYIGTLSLMPMAASDDEGACPHGPQLWLDIKAPFRLKGYGNEAVDAVLSHDKIMKKHRVINATHLVEQMGLGQALIEAGFLYTGRRTESDQGIYRHMIRIL